MEAFRVFQLGYMVEKEVPFLTRIICLKELYIY